MPPDPLPFAAPPVVLITRPQPAASDFAATLATGPVVIAPILRIVAVAHDAQTIAAAPALVLTSVHALPAAGAGRGRPAYCVGEATAAAAKAAGFVPIVGPGDLVGLLPLLAQADVPLLHVRGRHVTQAAQITGIVVYDQQAQALSDAATALLIGPAPVILPMFSPRSARLLAEAAAHATAPLRPVALSAAVAEAWLTTASPPFHAPVIAAKPDAQAMRNAIIPLQTWEQS